MAIAAAALMQFVGAGVEAGGQFLEADLEASALEYNSTLAKQEAIALNYSKKFALDKSKRENRRLLARQTAITAASGRGFFGSPLAIMLESQTQGKLDEQIITYNHDLRIGRAYGESRILKAQGKATRLFGGIKAVNTLTEGAVNSFNLFAPKKSDA